LADGEVCVVLAKEVVLKAPHPDLPAIDTIREGIEAGRSYINFRTSIRPTIAPAGTFTPQ
jgi:hypothetical protein